MKRLLYSILLLFTVNESFSQTNFNKVWVTGGGYSYSSTFNIGQVMNIKIDSFHQKYFDGGNSNICDSTGKLILVSDGMNLYDSSAFQFIENGDTLCSLGFYNSAFGFNSYSQTSIILPFDNKIYYLITLDASDSMFDWWYSADPNKNASPFDRLLYHKIDMNLNGGAGKVIERERVIVEHDSMLKSMMMVCKHANGKDWWLVKQMYEYGGYLTSKNKIATFLVTKDSIYPPTITYFPSPLFSSYDQNGQAMFCQNGTKYAATCRGTNKIFLADFDRCTGVFSHPKTYNVPNYSRHDPVDTTLQDEYTQALAFSENGNFLYVMKYWNILQLDMTDNDSLTAWYHVAGLDTTWQQFQLYCNSYLGKDNKLYIGNFSGLSKQMSIIENSNNKGASCNFCPRCFRFPDIGVNTPPCMPNYDLGEMLPCWPLGTDDVKRKEEDFVVYPNPASTILHIITDLNKVRELYNSVGQLIMSTRENELNVSHLTGGVYYLKCGNTARKIIID